MLKLSKNEKRIIKVIFGLMLVWTLIDGIRSMTYQDPVSREMDSLLQETEEFNQYMKELHDKSNE